VREAADWLEATQRCKRLVLVGLCSGADHSLIYAGFDRRVAGLVLLDPSIPRTRGHYLRYFGRRILQPRRWKDMKGSLGKVRARMSRLRGSSASDEAFRGQPDLDSKEVRAYLVNAYRRALEQEISFLAIFTGDREFLYNYRNQMLDALKGLVFGNRLQLEYFSGCDHTFSSEAQRNDLLDLVAVWMEKRDFVRGSCQPERASVGAPPSAGGPEPGGPAVTAPTAPSHAG
jgi:hypothetical protein